MHWFLTQDFDAPSWKWGDWAISFLSLAIGVWLWSPLWIAGGVLGCLASWYRPLTRLQAMTRNIITRRSGR